MRGWARLDFSPGLSVLPTEEHGRIPIRYLFRINIVKERRRSPRVRLHGEVHLQISGLSLRIPAADISVSGVGVLLDEHVLAGKPSGEVGVCRIEAPELGGRIEAYVSIMRVRRIGNVRLGGLRFESISDDELELIRQYKRKCRANPAAS